MNEETETKTSIVRQKRQRKNIVLIKFTNYVKEAKLMTQIKTNAEDRFRKLAAWWCLQSAW